MQMIRFSLIGAVTTTPTALRCLQEQTLWQMLQTSPHPWAQRHKEVEVTADFVFLGSHTSHVQQGAGHGEISTAGHELIAVFQSKFMFGCSGKPSSRIQDLLHLQVLGEISNKPKFAF